MPFVRVDPVDTLGQRLNQQRLAPVGPEVRRSAPLGSAEGRLSSRLRVRAAPTIHVQYRMNRGDVSSTGLRLVTGVVAFGHDPPSPTDARRAVSHGTTMAHRGDAMNPAITPPFGWAATVTADVRTQSAAPTTQVLVDTDRTPPPRFAVAVRRGEALTNAVVSFETKAMVGTAPRTA